MENLVAKRFEALRKRAGAKGYCGKILFLICAGIVGVVGGSQIYTGAPIFSAIAAFKTGADLAHVFCDASAAIPIKCYSPDFIVHPTFDSTSPNGKYDSFQQTTHKLTSLVVGPGLSPNTNLQHQAEFLVRGVLQGENSIGNIVFDADAFRFLPSVAELLTCESPNKLATKLKTFILAKGNRDMLYCPGREDAIDMTSCKGTERRCGGQGDLLAGALATILSWMSDDEDETISACTFASNLIRLANERAFVKFGCSLTTNDIVQFIGESFQELLRVKTFEVNKASISF